MEEIAVDHPDLWKPVSEFYGLQDEMAFDDLVTLLHSSSCCDQEDPVEGEPSVVERRAGIFRAAHALKRQALSMRQTYDQMRADLNHLHELLQDQDFLLEAVFDVDTRSNNNGFRSEKLDILYSFDGAIDQEKLREWLHAVETLVVRDSLKRGPIANTTLRSCVAACRDYWIDAEHRSWSMSSLKAKVVRDENKRANLQGECEAFVADLLDVYAIRFTLAELATAWTAVDKDALAAGGQAPGIEKRKLMLGGDS